MIKPDTIQIASPCSANWNTMVGDNQVRFCGGCRKNVYNLSEMTYSDAEALVNRLEGKLCARFYTRPDGTALTQDCPVGLRAVRYRRFHKFSYAAAIVLACTGGLIGGNDTAQAKAMAVKKAAKKPVICHPQPIHTMGGITAPKTIAPETIVPKPVLLPMPTMGLVQCPPLTDAPMPPQAETPAKK
jgi:hypothetical protein